MNSNATVRFNSDASNSSTVADTVNRFTESIEKLAVALEAPESIVNDFVDAGEEMADLVEKTAQQVEQNTERVADNADEIEELHEQVESNDNKIEDEKDRRGSEIEGCHNRISGLESDIEESTPTSGARETTTRQSDLTPIEQLSRADDPGEVTDSPTVKRAVSLFTNLPSWGSKTPKGFVLKPADNPLSLLEADREENLAWKQYYRAAEALEQLSEGSVTFFDSDRHGKMIVLHEQSETYERVNSGALTPSSVGAKG